MYINAVSLIDSPSFSLKLPPAPPPTTVDDRYNVRFNNADDDENENEDDNDRGEEE